MLNLKTGVFSAAALLATTALGSAATTTESNSFGFTLTNWGTSTNNTAFSPTQPIGFAGFNPALGTLTQVKISISGQVQGTLTLKNNGSTSSNVSAHILNTEKVVLPGVTVQTLLTPSNAVSQILAAGASTGPNSVNGSGNFPLTTITVGNPNFNSYKSAWNATAGDLGSVVTSSDNGNGQAIFTDQGKVSLNITYSYTPPPPPPPTPPPPKVPEPGTMALLGSGLVGLGVLRRRRKG